MSWQGVKERGSEVNSGRKGGSGRIKWDWVVISFVM